MTSPQAQGARVPASAAGAPATGPIGPLGTQFFIPGVSQAFPFSLPADSGQPAPSAAAAAAAVYGFSLFSAGGGAGGGAGSAAQGSMSAVAGFPVAPALLQRGQPGASIEESSSALGSFRVPLDPPSSSLQAAGQGLTSMLQLHSIGTGAARTGDIGSNTGRADLTLWPAAPPEARAPMPSASSTTVQAGRPGSANAPMLSLIPVPMLLAGGGTGPNQAAMLISSGSSIGSNESSTTAHASLTGQMALPLQNRQQQSLQVGLVGFPGAFQTMAPNISAPLRGSWIPGPAQLDHGPASSLERAQEAGRGTESQGQSQGHDDPEMPQRQGKRSRHLGPAEEVHLDMRLGLQGDTAPGSGGSWPRASSNMPEPSSLEGPILGSREEALKGGATPRIQRPGPKQETSTHEPLTARRREDGPDGHGEKHHKSQPLAPNVTVDVDGVMCKLRAKRGCATHPRSIAERVRRLKISENMRKLADLVPGIDKQANTADMLEEAIDYMKHLQEQLQAVQEKWPHVEVDPYVPRLDQHQTRQPGPHTGSGSGEGSPSRGQAKGTERYSGADGLYVDSDDHHSVERDEGHTQGAPLSSSTGLVAFLPTLGGGSDGDTETRNEAPLTERTFL